jgi:hypothetical protein
MVLTHTPPRSTLIPTPRSSAHARRLLGHSARRRGLTAIPAAARSALLACLAALVMAALVMLALIPVADPAPGSPQPSPAPQSSPQQQAP